MSAEVKKGETLYSVKIKSERIEYTIDGLTELEMRELRDAVDGALSKPKKEKKVVWNPRSKRHEEVDDDDE